MKCFLAFFVTFFYWLAANQAERILVLAPVCSKSHKISFMPIVEALAKKGHQVTVVTPYAPYFKIENITEISVENAFKDLGIDWFAMHKQSYLEASNQVVVYFRTIMKKGYDILMANNDFQEILQSRAVDLIIVDAVLNDFTLPIIDDLKVPFIMYSPTSNAPWVFAAMNVPASYATVPVGSDDKGSKMTFLERVGNVVGSEFFYLLRKYYILNYLDDVVKKDFPNSRPISEIERNSDLCIINSHPATAWHRSLPPNVIEIGALHTRPAMQLEPKLKNLADAASQGFIVFSLGSAIPVSSIPTNLIKIFVKVFSRFPEKKVFWKWEKTGVPLENRPMNVELVEWLPQQDLLAHKNAQLFISHGGLIGIQETVYHGVPILGLPFGNDQRGNLAKVRDEGYGIKLNWDELTEELLYETIHSLLHNPSYRENARRLSELMKDRLMPGEEVAVYWVEHILRHGSKHLHLESKNMPLYQIHLLDVWLFIITIIVTILFVTFKLVTCIVARIFKSRKVKTQ